MKSSISILIVLLWVLHSIQFLYSYDLSQGNTNAATDQLGIEEAMQSRFENITFFSETYFHEAHFENEKITVFVYVTIVNYGGFESGCKLNVRITYPDGKLYSLDREYPFGAFNLNPDPFLLDCGSSRLELSGSRYTISAEDEDINFSLVYDIADQPARLGDGKIRLQGDKYLYYSVPIAGADVSCTITNHESNILLNGTGFVYHDYTNIFPPKGPRYWRSLWLTGDSWTVTFRTIIFPDREQVDQLFILRDGRIYDQVMNCGLQLSDYVQDKETRFHYPTRYTISHIVPEGGSIEADFRVMEVTDTIRVFDHYPPIIRSLVRLFLPEMWSYRFWVEGYLQHTDIHGQRFNISLRGLGNYIDYD